MGQFFRWLAAIGLIAATPVLAWYAWQTMQASKSTAAWPTTEGVVTRAQLREAGTSRYATDVAYFYRVNGREYIGTRIRTTDPYHRLGAAKAAIEGFSPGQRLPVHYNPADPSEAILIPGAASGEAWLMIMPAATFVAGLAILAWLLAARGETTSYKS